MACCIRDRHDVGRGLDVYLASNQKFAGIILAAMIIEVFPEMRRVAMSKVTLIFSYVVGAAFMYGVKLLGNHLERGTSALAAEKQFNY